MTEPQLLAEDRVALYAADCFDMFADLDDNLIDAVICDPPYGLEFMGRKWEMMCPDSMSDTTGSDG